MKKSYALKMEKFNDGGIEKILPKYEIERWKNNLIKSAIENGNQKNLMILLNRINEHTDGFSLLKKIKKNFTNYKEVLENVFNSGKISNTDICSFAASEGNMELLNMECSKLSDEDKIDHLNRIIYISIESMDIKIFEFLIDFAKDNDICFQEDMVTFISHASRLRNYSVLQYLWLNYIKDDSRLYYDYCDNIILYNILIGNKINENCTEKIIKSLFRKAIHNIDYEESIEFVKKLISDGLLNKLSDKKYISLIDSVLFELTYKWELVLLLHESRPIPEEKIRMIITEQLLYDNKNVFDKFKENGLIDLITDKESFAMRIAEKGKMNWIEDMLEIKFIGKEKNFEGR